jgi:transcriptional regulator with XRE-family HTH domain
LEIYRRIGERIRHARLKAGMTQPQLATMLSVSKGIISRWETGQARPSLDRLEVLASQLSMSIEEMLGFVVSDEAGVGNKRSIPVWELGVGALPDMQLASAIGEVMVGEKEAFEIQGAFLMLDDSLYPHFFPGDLVGVKIKRRPKLGDVLFVRKGRQPVIMRYAGRKKGDILIPLKVCQDAEVVHRIDLLGVYRWLQRPGHVIRHK